MLTLKIKNVQKIQNTNINLKFRKKDPKEKSRLGKKRANCDYKFKLSNIEKKLKLKV